MKDQEKNKKQKNMKGTTNYAMTEAKTKKQKLCAEKTSKYVFILKQIFFALFTVNTLVDIATVTQDPDQFRSKILAEHSKEEAYGICNHIIKRVNRVNSSYF